MASTINDSVIEKFYKRAADGFIKYGTTMDRSDLSRLDWLVHAQQEAMDLCVYLEKLIQLEKGEPALEETPQTEVKRLPDLAPTSPPVSTKPPLFVIEDKPAKAERQLHDDSPMPFGKHKDRKLADVPAGYFLWLWEQEWFQYKFPDLHTYVKQNMNVLQAEADDSDPGDDPPY